jgi:hypothetical protein
MLISPSSYQEGNKLQRQNIWSFMHPIYNHNWRNISTIYINNKTSIKRNIVTIKKIQREVGRAKDLSAPCISRLSCYLVTGVSGKPIGEVFKDPETSVAEYQPKPRSVAEEWRSHLQWDESLNCRIFYLLCAQAHLRVALTKFVSYGPPSGLVEIHFFFDGS